jgi:ribosome-binding factor A
MQNRRLTRINELLRREIGGCLYHVIGDSGFDMSAITVTHVMTTSSLRSARVLVSIRDHEDEREAMISTLRRHRIEIQKHLSDNIVLKYTPRLTFSLDTSLEEGSHTLSILNELDEIEDNQGTDTNDGTTP